MLFLLAHRLRLKSLELPAIIATLRRLILIKVCSPQCYNNACHSYKKRYSNIMRPVRFVLQPLLDLFERLRALTMAEMKAALGTRVDMTVFRKLARLDYLTSYSHRGSYYSLKTIPRFDAQGLWLARGAWFSRHGTLLNAAEAAVKEAPAGYVASELETRLHVPVKDVLLQLALAGRIDRYDFHGLYLYTAKDRARRQEQRAARQALRERLDQEPDQQRAAIVLFYGLLDEPQRRLYAGLESLKQGHGGDRRLAEILGLDEETVARGRQELLAAKVQPDRVRQPGGGRPRAEKNARSLEDTGRPVARGYRRRSHRPAPSVDRQTTGANHSGVAAVGHRRQSPNRAAVARSTGLCLARQLQIALHTPRATGSAVSMHRPAQKTLCARRAANYQRRHQKEGIGRQLQKSRPGVEPATDPGQGS